jgi:spore coat polysaccharide biosynthesis protein SpsF
LSEAEGAFGILVTARLKSVRLPHKALLPLGPRPVVGHLVDRMRRVHPPGRIVLCTSHLAEDDPLAHFATAEGIDLYRGDPEDVLARLSAAAVAAGFATVACVTADNPWVDPVALGRLVAAHRAAGNEFTASTGLPWGAFGYVLDVAAMARACTLKDATDTEVWGGYFTATGRFRCATVPVADPVVFRPHYRLTIDTPEDYRLAQAIVEALGPDADLAAICTLLDARPDLVALNAGVVQKPGKPIRLRT